MGKASLQYRHLNWGPTEAFLNNLKEMFFFLNVLLLYILTYHIFKHTLFLLLSRKTAIHTSSEKKSSYYQKHYRKDSAPQRRVQTGPCVRKEINAKDLEKVKLSSMADPMMPGFGQPDCFLLMPHCLFLPCSPSPPLSCSPCLRPNQFQSVQ